MSFPRRIVAGKVYLAGRRCFGRCFFLRPSEKVNQINLFCLAVAAKRTGVLVHGYVFLANHYHLVITDVEGRLPEFMHWLNEYIAKCGNVELGRWESFWAPGSYSAVELTDAASILDALVYVNCNPVAAGLVAHAKDWPGAISSPRDMERGARTIARPTGFFRDKGLVPKTAQLQVSMPPGLDMTVDQLEDAFAERERQLREEARAKGRPFLGVKRILAQSPFDQPKTHAPRRGLNPRVAGKDKWKRIETLQRLKAFVSEYRDALREFMNGDRSVVFPFGTYNMRVRFGVLCSGP